MLSQLKEEENDNNQNKDTELEQRKRHEQIMSWVASIGSISNTCYANPGLPGKLL